MAPDIRQIGLYLKIVLAPNNIINGVKIDLCENIAQWYRCSGLMSQNVKERYWVRYHIADIITYEENVEILLGLALSFILVCNLSANVSITILRRFSEKKLRISEGIFVILLMALSFE